MYDLIIIGGGVAGLTAAIYAARAKLDAVVLERGMPGGQALETPEVENYPGLPHTDGVTLSMAVSDQAADLGAQVRTVDVTGWRREEGGTFTLVTDEGELTARTLLIASGATHRPLGAPGEDRLRGRGVSYCATCDGRFYRGKKVAVIGGGNTAVEDALYLSRLCEEVILIHRRDTLRAGKALAEQAAAAQNIRILWNTTVLEIKGENRVESLELLTDGEPAQLKVDGVFVAVGIQPNIGPFADLPRDGGGFILANEDGETAIPGLFAAGDIRSKRCRQLITAAGDGAAAATAAERYLSER